MESAGEKLRVNDDGLNRLTNMVDTLGASSYSYNAAGQLLSAGGLWPNDTVSYTYTNRERATLGVGTWGQGYAYDDTRRLKTLISPAGTFGYGYTVGQSVPAASRLIRSLQLPNGSYITNTFDPVARLAGTYLKRGTDDQVLDAYSYLYDPSGQRTNVLRDYGAVNSSAAAQYDAIGELTVWQAHESSGAPRLNEQLSYSYDAAGNLNRRTNNALIQQFNVNELNQLSTIGRSGQLTVSGNSATPASSITINGQPATTYADFTFASASGFTLSDGPNSFATSAKNYYGTVTWANTLNVNLPQTVTLQYDVNGNLTSDGVRTFGYDCENQLTNVTVAGQWREVFLYDGLNRRRITQKSVWQSGAWVPAGETRFIYDGNLAIQEWDNKNAVQVTYTRGLDLSASLQAAGGIGGLLSRTDASGTAFYHADGNGNITAMVDANQYLVARYLYDPFGKLLGKWGTLADANVYRFSSKEWDENSGLYYYLYRFYEPNSQRWLNRDPINERGGFNLYAFLNNDPLVGVDLFGLCDCRNGKSKVTDSAGATCCEEEMTAVSLNTAMPDSSSLTGHTTIQIGEQMAQAFALYPADNTGGWSRLWGVSPAPQVDPNYESKSHFWNPDFTQKFKLCPITLKKLRQSIKDHSKDKWGIIGGNTCTSWACSRLQDAGLNPATTGWLPSWPLFMPDQNPNRPSLDIDMTPTW